MSGRAAERQAGYTLSEVLIAVVILAVAVTSIVGAIGASVYSSSVHRDIVNSDALGRAYAEQLIAPSTNYVTCATSTTYPAFAGAAGSYSVRVTGVRYWNGSATADPSQFGTTCMTHTASDGSTHDTGAQLITITTRRGSTGPAQTINVVKREP